MRARLRGRRAKSKPSPQTSTRSASAGRRCARRPAAAGTARARRACSGSCPRGSADRPRARSPGCGTRSCLTRQRSARPARALNAASSSFEPQLDTSATGCCAAAISAARRSIAAARSTGRAASASPAVARGALEDLREVAPLVADPRAVDRRVLERRHALDARRSARGSSALSFHSGLRCQICTLQPRAQPGQTEGVGSRYQTRDL